MNITITGATGLVGTRLVHALEANGHAIRKLSRSRHSAPNTFVWDPQGGTVDPAALAGCDAVVHLAGENIAAGRWTDAQKARIRDSRVAGTRTICTALAGLDVKPKVLVSASAIGFYGDRGDAVLDENAPAGEGFLAGVCVAWERETQPAVDAGIRVVMPRIGVVLSPDGGALAKMLTPFKLGAGGVLGNGRQYLSWIDLDDLVGIIVFALEHATLAGPVNATAPNPATNREFTKTLGRVLHRPTIFPVPAAAAKLAFGEMAEALLLASTRVLPERVQQAGYRFQYPQLDAALRHQLDR
ncbi:MAG TPA: TIGR01777 family oxidoreductase [Phycisphaerae bacterium]|nr:TIGR01777 family protein [Phycisphaerales bacterium]HRX87073.1 TIGR01777 family oxidoreductase [Phycisphaerae bacterium]